MHDKLRVFACVSVLLAFASSGRGQESNPALETNWAQWRGPLGTGEAPQARPPVQWNETENVRWKKRIPGRGHSTPIVWEDRVYLTAAVAFGKQLEPRYSGAEGAHDNLPVSQRHRFVVLALNRRDGSTLWETVVREDLPHEGGHNTASLASQSPVTDGEFIYAFFGSRGLHCLDRDGKIKWQVDLGRMHTKHGHGEGSSPALHGNVLIVNWDHERQSFVVAVDKRTGDTLWRVERDEVTSWASPIVVEVDGKPQVIVAGTERVRGYDLETGKVVWECGGLSANIVATPVAANGMLFTGSSYEKRALLGIRLSGARGDITDTKFVVWSRTRGTPYVPSLLLYDSGLYFLSHYQGILTRVDAATGEEAPGAFRLPGIRDVYASPIAADGRVYITDRDGTTLVISGGKIPRAMALNKIDDSVNASLAAVDGELFIRGEKRLYCIAEDD